jgi:hypothetical protein
MFGGKDKCSQNRKEPNVPDIGGIMLVSGATPVINHPRWQCRASGHSIYPCSVEYGDGCIAARKVRFELEVNGCNIGSSKIFGMLDTIFLRLDSIFPSPPLQCPLFCIHAKEFGLLIVFPDDCEGS